MVAATKAEARGEGGLREHQDCGSNAQHITALEAEIIAEARATRDAAQSAIAHAIPAGTLLLQARQQIPHGEFAAFLTRLPFAPTTARGYMRLAGCDEEKRQRVAGLSLRRALVEIAEPTLAPTPSLRLVAPNDDPVAPEHDHGERYQPDTKWRRQRANGQLQRMVMSLSTMHGVCTGLDRIDTQMACSVCDADELKVFRRQALEIARGARRFAAKLTAREVDEFDEREARGADA